MKMSFSELAKAAKDADSSPEVLKERRKIPDDQGEPLVIRPEWRRRPTEGELATRLSSKALLKSIDDYCEKQYDAGQDLTLCDLAGAVGFDSVTQLVNHARRRGGDVMRGISRGISAVAAGYEEMAQQGNRNAAQLLAVMPQFDSDEPATQKPEHPFAPNKEISLNITGVSSPQQMGAQLTEQEAYLQLIQCPTYQEVPAAVIETEQTADGDYQVLELDPE